MACAVGEGTESVGRSRILALFVLEIPTQNTRVLCAGAGTPKLPTSRLGSLYVSTALLCTAAPPLPPPPPMLFTGYLRKRVRRYPIKSGYAARARARAAAVVRTNRDEKGRGEGS
jgi:hypothetical protein